MKDGWSKCAWNKFFPSSWKKLCMQNCVVIFFSSSYSIRSISSEVWYKKENSTLFAYVFNQTQKYEGELNISDISQVKAKQNE